MRVRVKVRVRVGVPGSGEVAKAASEPCAPWLLEEAMMRSSCSRVSRTSGQEVPSRPPMQ